MNKRKIIVAGPLPPPYFGVSNATKITLRGLDTNFNLLHLDTSDRREDLNFGKYDFYNIYLGIKTLITCFLLLLKKPEVLYLPISQSFPAFYRDAGFVLLGWIFNKKIVIHLRGGYFRQFYFNEKGFRRWVIKQTVSKSHKVIVLGHSLKKLFDGFINEKNIDVISNGVDVYSYKPDFIKRNKDKFRICFISNFELHKGWREILKCAILLKEKIGANKFEIIMAGKWRSNDDQKFANDFINQNDIKDVIFIQDTITGDEKIELLQSSHLFLMPTSYKYEGQPWAIIEAMSCGLPVISSPKGCIEETVIHNQNGFITPFDDIQLMEHYILQLVSDDSLVMKMSNESRILVEKHFSETIFIKNLINTLNNV